MNSSKAFEIRIIKIIVKCMNYIKCIHFEKLYCFRNCLKKMVVTILVALIQILLRIHECCTNFFSNS